MSGDVQPNWWLETDGEGYVNGSSRSVTVLEPVPDSVASTEQPGTEEEEPLFESFSIQKRRSALLCLAAGSSVVVGVGWIRKRGRHVASQSG
jgi:hypothetical protein